MKRGRLYWIEHKTDFEQVTSLVCQAAKRMCSCDLTDELWICAGTCKAFGSRWRGLQLPSVRLVKAADSRIWGSETAAVQFEKPSLHPVQCAGGLKSLLQLWSGYGKANLLACPFYLLSVIYSMYNTSSL